MVAVALVAVYVPLRAAGSPEPWTLAWLVAAVAATLVSPACGLTILAAIGPFTQAVGDDGRISAVPFLLAALGAGTAVRLVIARPWPRPSLPLILAAIVFMGTAVGVLITTLSFGLDRGMQGAQLWVPGIGGAMTVLICSAWVASRGDLRPLLVATASVSVGATLSLLNLASGDELRTSLLAWLLRADIDPNRLGGLIPAPNAAAAIFLVGFSVAAGLALLHWRREVRFVALGAAAVQLVALALTHSRAALLGLCLAGAVLIWRRWRRLGRLTAFAVVIVAAAVAISAGIIRDVPVVADENRLAAWVASVRMWLDHPLVGAGFRSFEWLHGQYGSPILDAPHNEWLRFFAEEGTFVGVAGVVFALVTPISLLRVPGYVGAGAAAAAAGLFMMASFNNPFLYPQVNVPGFLIIGAGLGLALRRFDEPSEPGESPTHT